LEGQTFPYYENLCIIFEKNRAAGQDAQGLEDIEEEVNKEDENDDRAKKDVTKSSSSQEPSERVETSFVKSENLGKRA